MGAPMGNQNAAGPHKGGGKGRSKSGKKSKLKTIRRTSSTGTSIHTFSTKKSKKLGRSSHPTW